ncbi:hypothetical protein SEPCBS57363_003042 [Sporothrix epigloea]|uniref:Chromo domain-containing protein n=1 Tax=Sporothrix epigloea TaxID=1892477 RepID=A0ABP0DNH4_9PEZI
MSGNAIALSPQVASFSSSNLDKYDELDKSTKDSKADLKRQKPAKQTKATRPAKRLLKSTVQVPPIDDRSEVGDESGEWFAIRDIVDEKVERGVRQYLVDWEDHPVTGEVYPKSWVQLTTDCAQNIPASDANEEAVLYWQAIRQARKLQNKVKLTPKLRTKSVKPAETAKENLQAAVADTVETGPAPNPAQDSQSSFVNGSSVLTYAGSQALSPSLASSNPTQNLSRKRPVPTSDKENEESEDSETNEKNVAQRPRKRRLVRGIRPEIKGALKHSEKGDENNSQNSTQSTSIKSSNSGDRGYGQNSQKESQSQPLPSSPPASHEQSCASPTSIAEVAEVGELVDSSDLEIGLNPKPASIAVPVTSIDVTPNPGFNPDDYAYVTQARRLSQIARDSLQARVWLLSQSVVSNRDRQLQYHSLHGVVCSASSYLDDDTISSSSSIQGPNSPRLESGRTIPDSQQDDTQPLSVDRLNDKGVYEDNENYSNTDSLGQGAQTIPTGKTADEPCPSQGIASASNAASAAATTTASTKSTAINNSLNSGDAQLVPVPASSQNDQQLRASADWVSQDKPHSQSSRSLSIQFLTQPDLDFALFTQPSQRSQPSRFRHSSQPVADKTLATSNATSKNEFSAISVVPDSARAIRASTLSPRPHTCSPCPSHLGLVTDMHESFVRPRPSSAAEALQQALRSPHQIPDKNAAPGSTDLIGLSSIHGEDDPLVLAEIQRMQQEDEDISIDIDDPDVLAEIQRMEQESQNAIGSSAEDPLLLAEIQRLQGASPSQILHVSQEDSASSSSNILPMSLSTAPPVDSTLALSTDTGLASSLQCAFPLLAAADTGPAAVGPSVDVLIGQNATFAPDAQHSGGGISHVPPNTISMSDLNYAAPPTLDLSSEPDLEAEEFVEQNSLEQLSSPLSMDEDADGQVDQLPCNQLPPQVNSNFGTNSYVVTLPLAANTRQKYIDLVIDKKTQQIIKDFSEVYARDVNGVPDREAIDQIDDLLHKMLDLSDLPPFFNSLPAMSDDVMMKHAVNTNSKFSFVYEFLNDIATKDKSVLILGRKGVMNDYLEAVASASNLPVQRFEASKYTRPAAQSRERRTCFTVVLADTAEMAEARSRAVGTDKFPRPEDFDIVIGFDHTARTSGLIAYFIETALPNGAVSNIQKSRSAQTSRYQSRKPLALLLVSALTLEHVDLRLELDSVDDLERKNALLLCTLESLRYLKDVPYEDAPNKPHQVAEAFAKTVKDPAAALEWEPTPLPEDVFDIYMHSSGPSSQPVFTQYETVNGGLSRSTLKRQFNDSGDDEKGDVQAKRTRLETYGATLPIVDKPLDRYSDGVKQVVAGLGVDDSEIGPIVTISQARLEALAAKVTDLGKHLQEKESLEVTLTERVHTLNRLVKGQTATINDCQVKLLAAVKERGVFERERDAAVKEAALTKEKFESRTTALAELRTAKKDADASLAAANALAAGSSQPDVAELGAARVALHQAQEKMATLERKVTGSSEELEFARRAYQDASNAAAEMSAENRDLAARVKELDRLAADNLRKIHETQNRNELEAYRQQWTEAMTVLSERERELEIARDELRTLKNGRRETRQCSVPRSPRLSVMGARNISGRGGNGGGASSSGRGSTPILASVGADFAAAARASARASASRGNSPVATNLDASGQSHTGNNSGSGSRGGSLLPGPTYVNAGQSSSRLGHLRD